MEPWRCDIYIYTRIHTYGYIDRLLQNFNLWNTSFLLPQAVATTLSDQSVQKRGGKYCNLAILKTVLTAAENHITDSIIHWKYITDGLDLDEAIKLIYQLL